MAIHVQEVTVDAFRGIRQLKLSSLNHVNLIVGDNNCGKTSILEALLLLRNPADLTNIFRVSRQRDANHAIGRISNYDCFVNLLPHETKNQSIGIHAVCRNTPVSLALHGSQTRIMIDESDVYGYSFLRSKKDIPPEAAAYHGSLDWSIGTKHGVEQINIHEYSKFSGMELRRSQFLDMTYLSPVDHVRNSILNNIVRNKDYKEICMNVIQMFDPHISDLLILKNEQTNRPVEYIGHQMLGNMPASTYGDGVKKALLLANAIASAAGGVLLIDEIDTAIHTKYYDDLFRFVVKACRQFDVQLFITTHNIEAVDALLATQDYDAQSAEDSFTVMTLKKNAAHTLTRTLSGREVYNNREAFNFEVRL